MSALGQSVILRRNRYVRFSPQERTFVGAKEMSDCYESYISEQTDRKIFGTETRLLAFLGHRGALMER
jgi:hypothetical protein